MRKYTLLLLFILFCLGSASSIDLYINDIYRKKLQSKSLQELSYPVLIEGRFAAGVSFLEGLPLFINVYKIEITHAFGTKKIEGSGLADQFGSWMFFINSQNVDINIGNDMFRRVTRIRVWGEEIGSRDLNIWIGWEGLPELHAELQRFASIHNLDITATEVPSIESKLTSAARSRASLPDICMIQSDYLPALTESGILQRLDYFPTPDLLPKGTDAFSREGSRWAIPFYFDTQLLFYNTEIVKSVPEASIPDISWSLSDFESLCGVLLDNGISPITWNAYSAYWLIPFQIGFGKNSIIEADNSIQIDDRPTYLALSYIIDLVNRNYLDIRERDGMMSRFFGGDVAMILSGSYSIPEFESLGIPFGVVQYPYNMESGKNISPLLDFKAFAITRKTKNPVLARRVIEYLTGVGVQQRFCSKVSKLAANIEAWQVMKLRNPYYEALYRSYAIGTVIPPEDSYKIFKNTMWKLLRFAITGEMSVEETLSEGQKIINNKLKTRSER